MVLFWKGGGGGGGREDLAYIVFIVGWLIRGKMHEISKLLLEPLLTKTILDAWGFGLEGCRLPDE